MDVRQTHSGEETTPDPTGRLSRRALLRATLGLAGAAFLAACGGTPTATTAPGAGTAPSSAPSAAPGASAAASSAPSAAPPAAGTATRVASPAAGGSPAASGSPAAGGKIASTMPGVPDAYTATPPVFKSYNGVPGSGGKVNVFTIAYQSPPPPRDQNTYWKELEKRLGVTWEPIITPQPNYGEKSAALIAGGNLPELFYLNPGQNAAPQYKAMDQGAFLDLTPYVTGDALKEFKNLATIPPDTWKNVSFKGKYYGVPKPIQRSGNIPFTRGDWVQKLGKQVPKSMAEAHDLLIAFTKNDPDGNGQADTWGMGRYGTAWDGWDNTLAFNAFGTPFNWRVNSDGTMTSQIETDEFKQALDWLRQLFADGGYHPDAGGMTFAQAQSAFLGGKTGLHSEGFGNFVTPKAPGTVYAKIVAANAKAVLTGVMPPGTKPVTRNTQGSFGFTAIPSSVKDTNKVKEYLRLLDYLAAPFGSEEWTFLNYGVEGVDFMRDANGIPVLTDKGTSERGDLVYVMAGLPVFYYPQAPGAAEAGQKQALEIFKIGIDDPTWPLYSATNVSKLAELNQFGFDQVTAIITGRQPMSSFDQAVKDWKSRGGDMIRQEFQESLKNAK